MTYHLWELLSWEGCVLSGLFSFWFHCMLLTAIWHENHENREQRKRAFGCSGCCLKSLWWGGVLITSFLWMPKSCHTNRKKKKRILHACNTKGHFIIFFFCLKIWAGTATDSCSLLPLSSPTPPALYGNCPDREEYGHKWEFKRYQVGRNFGREELESVMWVVIVWLGPLKILRSYLVASKVLLFFQLL